MKFKKSSLLVKLVILILLVYSTVTLVSLQNQLQDKKAEAAQLTAEAQQAGGVVPDTEKNISK